MDIYSAEIQVNKLLNYVKSLSDSKPRMYQKSKDRLKELANTCNQVIVVISEILQDEVLIDDQDEFGGSGVTDFNAVLSSMEDQISELRQFLSSPKPTIDFNEVSKRKHALYEYKNCMDMLKNSDILVQEAEGCSKLLWTWFSSRFLNGPDSFKYNMKRLPGWIRDIVVLYCYHFENETLDSFESEFYDWISTISSGNNNYAVPYEVYIFDTSLDPNYLTLSSVVMWDILLDFGLRNLCVEDNSGLYPTEDCIYSLVDSLDSSLLDPYQNYMYDSSILNRCNFSLKGGDIE